MFVGVECAGWGDSSEGRCQRQGQGQAVVSCISSARAKPWPGSQRAQNGSQRYKHQDDVAERIERAVEDKYIVYNFQLVRRCVKHTSSITCKIN